MISPRLPRWVLLAAAVLAACADSRSGARSGADRPAAGITGGGTDGTAGSGAARLDSAARRVVAFLRGELPSDSIAMADTIVLRLAPEGGGDETRAPRAALHEPAAWVVRTERGRYVLTPPVAYGHLTSRVGRHFDCQEYSLATRAPAWASLPHVGVRLAPDTAAGSCLRTWNATLVFDTSAADRSPRLTGVLYDQWEW